jgi:type III pantothenate kinase
MLLAIDIGNTNTVFAVYQNDKLKAFLKSSWRFQTIAARTSDEYAALLNQVFTLEGISWGKVVDVIVSSVVPDADFNVRKFCKKYMKKEPTFITAKMAGIKVEIDKPEEVGADRLVNAIAVREHYKIPAIVIDFGTATTFDVINAKGHYAGGVIAPGINLSIEALHRAAAKLPKISIKAPQKAIGKSTVTAIQSGIYWGYIGLIEGLVERISKEMGGKKPFVLATGGLAPLFADNTKVINAVDEELTLKGLLCIYKDLKKK